jgi:predicted dehydrogenase
MHGTMTRRLRELVAQDFFGRLTWMSVLDSRGHWWSDSPFSTLESHWKLMRAKGGGIVFHCGIHQLDMIRCYLGPIDEVTAYRAPVNALTFYPADVPDNVTLMLRAKSGAVCNFQIFHNRAPCYYRETNAWQPDWRTIPGHEFDVSVVGTKASAHMQIYKEKLALFKFDQYYKDTTLERVEDFAHHPANASHHDMNGFLLAYLRNVAAGKGALDPASDALETMKLAFAAEDAIATGKTTYLKDYA